MANGTSRRVFISYSWTSDAYQRAVVSLAKQLCHDGVDVVIDVWYLRPGHDKYAFMERCVTDASIDKVLILCDRAYAKKADARAGGVGDETVVITPQVYGRAEQERFIPVVMERGASGEAYLPAYLGSRMYVDLSGGVRAGQYEELLRCIFDKPRQVKPPLGTPPAWLGASAVHGEAGVGAGAAASTANVPAKRGIADYSWDELKSIAERIASAKTDAEGLSLAQSYRLVDARGKLQGDTKSITLTNGMRAAIRIAGFRHDVRADARGKAGITFEFADAPVEHRMNSPASNAGGWEGSEMRSWLNHDFHALLPDDVRSGMVSVLKRTNNVGEVTNDIDVAKVVTLTPDKLWLFSAMELYGGVPSAWFRHDVYAAEGGQYQLCKDQGVSMDDCGFCVKKGASPYWWLRSPDEYGTEDFCYISPDGRWRHYRSYAERGVSPGFCF